MNLDSTTSPISAGDPSEEQPQHHRRTFTMESAYTHTHTIWAPSSQLASARSTPSEETFGDDATSSSVEVAEELLRDDVAPCLHHTAIAAQVVDRLRWWRLNRVRHLPLPQHHVVQRNNYTNYAATGVRPLSPGVRRSLERASGSLRAGTTVPPGRDLRWLFGRRAASLPPQRPHRGCRHTAVNPSRGSHSFASVRRAALQRSQADALSQLHETNPALPVNYPSSQVVVLHHPPRLVAHVKHVDAADALRAAGVARDDIRHCSYALDPAPLANLLQLPLFSFERFFYGEQLRQLHQQQPSSLITVDELLMPDEAESEEDVDEHSRSRPTSAAPNTTSSPSLPPTSPSMALTTWRERGRGRHHRRTLPRGPRLRAVSAPVLPLPLGPTRRSHVPPRSGHHFAQAQQLRQASPIHTCTTIDDIQDRFVFNPLVDRIGAGAFAEVYAALPILRGGANPYTRGGVGVARRISHSRVSSLAEFCEGAVLRGREATMERKSSPCIVALKLIPRLRPSHHTPATLDRCDRRWYTAPREGKPPMPARRGNEESAACHRELMEVAREISVLRHLHHTGCSRFCEALRTPEHYAIAMEMRPGSINLRDYLARFGPPSEKRTALLLAELLTTIQYLHQRFGLVHRDIKLENLLISPIDSPRATVVELVGTSAHKEMFSLSRECSQGGIHSQPATPSASCVERSYSSTTIASPLAPTHTTLGAAVDEADADFMLRLTLIDFGLARRLPTTGANSHPHHNNNNNNNNKSASPSWRTPQPTPLSSPPITDAPSWRRRTTSLMRRGASSLAADVPPPQPSIHHSPTHLSTAISSPVVSAINLFQDIDVDEVDEMSVASSTDLDITSFTSSCHGSDMDADENHHECEDDVGMAEVVDGEVAGTDEATEMPSHQEHTRSFVPLHGSLDVEAITLPACLANDPRRAQTSTYRVESYPSLAHLSTPTTFQPSFSAEVVDGGTTPLHPTSPYVATAVVAESAVLCLTPCGTERYLSPEQLEWMEMHKYGERRQTSVKHAKMLDMYAVGVVAYVLLSGHFPSNSTNRATLLQQHQRVPPCSSINWLGVSAEAIQFVQRLLEPDPDKRLTASEALDHPFLRDALRAAEKLEVLPHEEVSEGNDVLEESGMATGPPSWTLGGTVSTTPLSAVNASRPTNVSLHTTHKGGVLAARRGGQHAATADVNHSPTNVVRDASWSLSPSTPQMSAPGRSDNPWQTGLLPTPTTPHSGAQPHRPQPLAAFSTSVAPSVASSPAATPPPPPLVRSTPNPTTTARTDLFDELFQRAMAES